MDVGDAESVASATGQLALLGAVAEQEPLHWIVPVFVEPQALAEDVQALPYPEGFAGVDAEHEPLHWIVPVFVEPQALAADVHDEPYPEGLAGAEETLHVPLH